MKKLYNVIVLAMVAELVLTSCGGEPECTNLLVPVCFSASYIAYAAARMEPVFMLLGESAGVAACQSLEEKKSVQEIDLVRLRERLRQAGQVLEWQRSGKWQDRPAQPVTFTHSMPRTLARRSSGAGISWETCRYLTRPRGTSSPRPA